MKKKQRSAFLLESLEPRLLFSADLAPMPADGGPFEAEPESNLEISLRPDGGGEQATDTDENERREIIFVDEAVDDFDQLVADLESQREKGRRFDIVALDSDNDGIAQVTEYLSRQEDIASVHFMSHGTDGEVILGKSRLNATTLDSYAEAIEGWQRSLSGNADLLFYGCNLAAGHDGQDLVKSLTLLTGADVAASDDVTGSAHLGGDWDLEYSKGEIETNGALTAIFRPVWQGVLGQITVNTNNDTLDGDANTNNLADLAMNPGSDGLISLREAIKAANNDPDADTIFLEAEIYNITRFGIDDDFGDFDIREDLSIVGVSPNTTIIDGNDASTVFDVHDNAAITVSFSNLKIEDGNSTIFGEHQGAGLSVAGGANMPDVFLDNVWFSGNTANLIGMGQGGAIYNAGNLTITSALIEGNSADEGGGVWNATGGVLYMENVTLSGNDATSGDGGGLFNEGGTATLYHVTITENSASNVGGGVIHDGGAIETTIGNSIIAWNTAGSSPDIHKVSGDITSAGGNIIRDAGNTGGNFAPTEIGIDPDLGGLTDNGGDLMTHEPAAVEAIDNADSTISSAVDQRGFLRDDGSPDIGAHEVGASTTPGVADLWLSTDSVVVGGGQAGDDSWNPSDLVAIGDPQLNLGPGSTSGTFAIAFDANGFSVGWDVNAAHYVTAPLQIGSTNFQLKAGDLLLSPKYNGTIFTSNNVVPLDTGFLASVTADKEDLVVFRPDSVGDFSKGQFAFLLEDVAGAHELRGITMVEQTITVGGRVLDAGDFLYARSGPGDDHSIWLYETGTVGAGATPDNRFEFLNGDDAGVSIQEQIHGIELLEDTMRVGNHVLAAGTILINVNNTESVGSNGLDVDRFDVFALDVSTSSLVGAGQASAQMLFDGSDVAFDSNEEDLDAVMLVPNGASNSAPILADDNPTLTAIDEDDVTSTGDSVAAIVVDGSITDADGAVESIAITAVDDTNGTWQYSTDNGGTWADVDDGSLAVDHALLLDGTLTGASTQKLRFVPDSSYNGMATFTFRAWDQSSGSAGTYADTTSSGGTTAFSSATDTAAITINALNDAGTVTIDNTTPAQGDTLTANVVDPNGASGAISYQWFIDGIAIGGAIGKTYTTTQADVGTVITVMANYTDDMGTAESPTSAATAAVTNVNDTGSVTIDNLTPAQGDTLTASVSDPDGASGIISYQWFSDGIVIGGASSNTYTTTQADVGTVITVTATYTDDSGTAESPTSSPTDAVTNVNETPVAVNDSLNATEDQSITFATIIDLLGNDLDTDGDVLTLSGFTQPANGSLVDNGDGTLTYTPSNNFSGTDSFGYTIDDGNGQTASGSAIIVVAPVGDTPQVTDVSTSVDTQSGPIYINRHTSDGPEVSHFKISGITNGTLYLDDGVTRIDDGDFITLSEGQSGLRFTPTAGSTENGSFNVESSEDGVSVSSQSGVATATITILTAAPVALPSAPQVPPLIEPQDIIDEEVDQEETEEEEDLVDEGDAPAAANNTLVVETPVTTKTPGMVKPSFNPTIISLRQQNLDRDDDRSSESSPQLSPQTVKKLIESQNLGDLKAALKKLNISALPPETYNLVRNSLDAVKEEIGNEMMLDRAVMGSAIATSVGLSAGYVVWMLKGGSLLASVLSSLPAWQLADPLAILVGKKGDDNDEEDDSLRAIIEEGSEEEDEEPGKTSKSDNRKKESKKR